MTSDPDYRGLDEQIADAVIEFYSDIDVPAAPKFSRKRLVARIHTCLRPQLQRHRNVMAWSDELRDRIRDIYLNTSQEVMRREDSAGHEIASAEKECRIRHEAILRPRKNTAP